MRAHGARTVRRLKLKVVKEVFSRKKCAKKIAPTTSMPYLWVNQFTTQVGGFPSTRSVIYIVIIS